MDQKMIIIVLQIVILLTGCNVAKDAITLDTAKEIKQTKEPLQTPGASPAQVEKKQLTLEIVRELSKKGENLKMEDFDNYIGTEMGSGLYIVNYPIDDRFSLLVGSGSLQGKPLYVRLNKIGTEKGVDIRTEDIEQFIKR